MHILPGSFGCRVFPEFSKTLKFKYVLRKVQKGAPKGVKTKISLKVEMIRLSQTKFNNSAGNQTKIFIQ